MPFALRPSLFFSAVLMAAAAPLSAQNASAPPDPGLSLTPYVGMVMPTAALLARPSEAPLKLSSAVTFGARLGINVNSHVGFDADVGYSPGSLELDDTGVKTNQDVQTTTASGRLTLYLIPRSSPVWLGVSGGAAAIRHTFSNSGLAATSEIKAGTNIGGVIGASAGIRLGKLFAVNFGAEDYMYSASFDINGAKTAERKQHDIRFSAGFRFPFLGI